MVGHNIFEINKAHAGPTRKKYILYRNREIVSNVANKGLIGVKQHSSTQ